MLRSVKDMQQAVLGRTALRFHYECIPHVVEGLPKGVDAVSLVWEKGSKICYTDPAAVDQQTGSAIFREAMRQSATIYKEGRSFVPKEYKFKIQSVPREELAALAAARAAGRSPDSSGASTSSRTARRKTIARALVDLAQYAGQGSYSESHRVEVHLEAPFAGCILHMTVRAVWLRHDGQGAGGAGSLGGEGAASGDVVSVNSYGEGLEGERVGFGSPGEGRGGLAGGADGGSSAPSVDGDDSVRGGSAGSGGGGRGTDYHSRAAFLDVFLGLQSGDGGKQRQGVVAGPINSGVSGSFGAGRMKDSSTAPDVHTRPAAAAGATAAASRDADATAVSPGQPRSTDRAYNRSISMPVSVRQHAAASCPLPEDPTRGSSVSSGAPANASPVSCSPSPNPTFMVTSAASQRPGAPLQLHHSGAATKAAPDRGSPMVSSAAPQRAAAPLDMQHSGGVLSSGSMQPRGRVQSSYSSSPPPPGATTCTSVVPPDSRSPAGVQSGAMQSSSSSPPPPSAGVHSCGPVVSPDSQDSRLPAGVRSGSNTSALSGWMWPLGRKTARETTTEDLMRAIAASKDVEELQKIARGLLAERNDYRQQAVQWERAAAAAGEQLREVQGSREVMGERLMELERQVSLMTDDALVEKLVQAKMYAAERDMEAAELAGQLQQERERGRQLTAQLAALQEGYEAACHKAAAAADMSAALQHERERSTALAAALAAAQQRGDTLANKAAVKQQVTARRAQLMQSADAHKQQGRPGSGGSGGSFTVRDQNELAPGIGARVASLFMHAGLHSGPAQQPARRSSSSRRA